MKWRGAWHTKTRPSVSCEITVRPFAKSAPAAAMTTSASAASGLLSIAVTKIDAGTLETGKAVVLASLTNIAGFGTLIFANYPALKSFGLVASIGSLSCLLTALTLVPAMMAKRT